MVLRWMHASCQGLTSDEEVENAADDGFDCTMCRMVTLPNQGMYELSEEPSRDFTETQLTERNRTLFSNG